MKTYVLQIIATKSKDEAIKVFESLKKKNLPVRIDKVNNWYKVRIGNFKSYEEAKEFVLSHNLEGKGYISLIDYKSSRTILISNPKKMEISDKNINSITLKHFSEVTKSGNNNRNKFHPEKKEKNFQNQTYFNSISKDTHQNSLKVINRKGQKLKSMGEKTKNNSMAHKIIKSNSQKEEGMNFEVITILVTFTVIFLVIIKYLIKKLKEENPDKNEVKNETEIQINNENPESYEETTESNKSEGGDEMEIEEAVQNQNPVEEEKLENEEFIEEKGGSIVSYGKLIVGKSTSISGDIVSKESVVVEDNSKVTGSITAEKHVKLGRNVRTGKILTPIVHTIRDGELPKIPETEVPLSGGLKSNGDLELSDGLLIQGNIEVGGNLKIGRNSKILGNVSAKNVIVDEGTLIYGKISSLQDVEIRNKVIVGSGPGKGGITAGGTVRLGSSVVILGNINAKEVLAE